MDSLEIKSNRHWHEFKYGNELPLEELCYFDYVDDIESENFIHYRDAWYHIGDFLRITPSSPFDLSKWDGIISEGFYSGVLINISKCGSCYQIGRYIC